MKDLRVTVDGESHDVDNVEEAGCIPPEEDEDKEDRIVVYVWYTGDGWAATVTDPDIEYRGHADRKWGAIRDLFETVDERARRFGF
ncbi:hypothetical protein [Halorubrum ezzemoulense]|jgi:hypothetical protein|uniref:Uncharacterized protein n=1 Tax=Halorubrum ezzemoulense TaxID=337243 RepID=A0A256JDP2_HALEZ|nr:hypothetical protein [Halorubrum ezzemoulense]OYR66958.1 hypothetical protein DJ78_16760 [Halorubrum ezzemoulense]